MSSRAEASRSASPADPACRGEVVRHGVPAEHVTALGSDVVGEPGSEVGAVGEGPVRSQVLLGVELDPLAQHGPVQMDRQLGDAQQGLVGVEQPRLQTVGGAHDDTSGQAEVAVQPRGDQRRAVDLHPQRVPPRAHTVGVRLETQVGGVGVRADHPERCGRAVGGLGGPGDQRPRPAHQVAPGLARRPVGLDDLGEALLAEQGCRAVDGVEGRRGGVQKAAQPLGHLLRPRGRFPGMPGHGLSRRTRPARTGPTPARRGVPRAPAGPWRSPARRPLPRPRRGPAPAPARHARAARPSTGRGR